MVSELKAYTVPPSAAKARILVVDDSRLIRSAALKIFGEDFDVVLAENGREGWQKIQEDASIQVVFTDLVMPELDGFELLELVRTTKDEGIRNLPVIVITGADKPEAAKEKAFSLGATDFITKPFNGTDIKARARTHAHYRRTTQALEEQTTLDVLTGALNNRGLQLQLEKDTSFVARHGENLTVMAIEVDEFKGLFVRIGRKGAEAIIKKVAEVLLSAVRKEDAVARTGLASFVVSLPMARTEGSLELADRICRTVESFRASLQGKTVQITVSVGVCVVEAGCKVGVEPLLDAIAESYSRAVVLGRSQIYELSMKEYQQKLAEEVQKPLSIDALLELLTEGEQHAVANKLDEALERMAPLLILMSNEQKQRVIAYR